MICKHCGYDVPRGIDFCTNCGNPMPKAAPTPEEIPNQAEIAPPRISQKEFTQNYVPYSIRLCIQVGAIMSYLYSALYLFLTVGTLFLGNVKTVDIMFLITAALLLVLTLGFHLKKNFPCALLITLISVIFSVICFVLFRQITFIWIFAGFLASYGTAKYNKLWKDYTVKGILQKKLD